MHAASGPVLVRIPERRSGGRARVLVLARWLLLLVGVVCVGYYSYALGDEYVYQSYQNWAFDQQMAGRRTVTFGDFFQEKILGRRGPAVAAQPAVPPAVEAARPLPGSLLGRLEIPRLNLSAIVREGVDADTLSRAVGHVPSTALPGLTGNFAIAAHRDTLFRSLKDIQQGDVVTFQSQGAQYSYEVFHTRIVKPSEVSVLRADGGLPQSPTGENRGGMVAPGGSMLTMITCYPFYYVGSAPERFIVQARLISKEAPAVASEESEAASAGPGQAVRKTQFTRPSAAPKRYFKQPAKAHKHGFWHNFLHAS